MSVNGQDFREPLYWLNKVNLKTYTGKTGAELVALSGIQLGKIYRCTSTSNGFIINNYYMRDGNDQQWTTVYAIGGWQEIVTDSIRQGVYWDALYPRKEQFTQETSTGGTIVNSDTSGGVELDTSAAIDGRAQISHRLNTCKVDWSKPAIMKFKMEFNDAEAVIGRIGLHVSAFTVIPSNSDKQVGLEIDQTPATDTFWSIISSDGTTKTTTLTSNNPVTGSNTYRYILEYIPNQSIKLYVNGALIATKTNNLPNTGSSTTNHTFVCNVRSRAADGKSLSLRSIVLAFSNANVS